MFTRHFSKLTRVEPGLVVFTRKTNPGRTRVSSVYTTETNPGQTRFSLYRVNRAYIVSITSETFRKKSLLRKGSLHMFTKYYMYLFILEKYNFYSSRGALCINKTPTKGTMNSTDPSHPRKNASCRAEKYKSGQSTCLHNRLMFQNTEHINSK